MSAPNTVTLDNVAVLLSLKGGRTVLSKAMPAHEARVLKALHGAGNVTVNPELAEDMEPTTALHANAHMEYARLVQCYRDRDLNPVAIAFPGGAEDLVAHGFTLGDEREVTQQPRSISVNHGLEERKAAAKAKRAAKEPKGGKAS